MKRNLLPFAESTNININIPGPAKPDPNALVRSRFYKVPQENMAFVDRPDITERIFKSLSNTSSHGCRIVALQGRGGTGKTQVMLRYCYANRDHYSLVF